MIDGLRQIPLEVICKDERPGFAKRKTVYFNILNDNLSFNGCEDLNGGQNCKLCETAAFEKLKSELESLIKEQN